MAVRRREQVERKIYFFVADLGQEATGERSPFDALRVLKHIDGLPFDSDGRYLRFATEDSVTCLFVDQATARRASARWARIRRDALPEIERGGSLTDLDIAEDAGVAETTHVRFFPDNIVGCDYNHYAPRITSLGYYLHKKVSHLCPSQLRFEPLFRPDVRAKLRRLQDVRMLRIATRANIADAVADADETLGRALTAAAEAGNAEVVEIVLRRIRPMAGDDMVARVRRIADRLLRRPNVIEEIPTLELYGTDTETEHVEKFDLLTDKLVTTKKILKHRPRSRVLDAESAYAAIDEAYNELRTGLHAAAGVAT